MSHRVLFLGDDRSYRETARLAVSDGLRSEFFSFAKSAIPHLAEHGAELLVLESNLADMAPLSFLGLLRRSDFGRDLPAIFLTARKTKQVVVEGFNLGLEDLMEQPVDARELYLRIKAVLRRRYERAETWAPAISSGPMRLDPSRRLCMVEGREVPLRPVEFALLEAMMRREGRVLTREFLFDAAWDGRPSVDSRAVDVAISALRRRLGRAGKAIVTIYKAGYSFRINEILR